MVRELYPLWSNEETEGTLLANTKSRAEPKACKTNVPTTASELSQVQVSRLFNWRTDSSQCGHTEGVLCQPYQPVPEI